MSIAARRADQLDPDDPIVQEHVATIDALLDKSKELKTILEIGDALIAIRPRPEVWDRYKFRNITSHAQSLRFIQIAEDKRIREHIKIMPPVFRILLEISRLSDDEFSTALTANVFAVPTSAAKIHGFCLALAEEQDQPPEQSRPVGRNLLVMNKAYHLDAFAAMKRTRTGTFHLVVTDPPSGDTLNKWDTLMPIAEWWMETKRILRKNGAVIVVGTWRFLDRVKFVLHTLGDYDAWVRHQHLRLKVQGTGHLNCAHGPLNNADHALLLCQGKVTYHAQLTPGAPYTKLRNKPRPAANYGEFDDEERVDINEGVRHPLAVMICPDDVEHFHPTQKPEAWFRYLIETYSDPGDKVFDPYAGSGTTAVAAVLSGRQFIVCDKNSGYVRIIQQRIKDTKPPSKVALGLD